MQLERSVSWLHSRCPSLLDILSIPYKMAVQTRGELYTRGWLTPQRLPCPVISVGNMTVGGTGKTPFVMWLANWLRSHGQRVGILSRGYRRKSTAERLLVSDGQACLVSQTEAGDEPYLIAQNCPGVVVAVGKNRYDVGQWVLEHREIDCFILDDGFQHLRLHRDCDLLLIDALDQRGLSELLPRGRLREPLDGAGRATAILITRVEQVSSTTELVQRIQSAIGRSVSPIYVRFDAQKVKQLKTEKVDSLDWLLGKRAVLVSGIGNAMAFRQKIEQLDVTIIETFEFPDHVSYTSDHVAAVQQCVNREKADLVLTTEKDGVKLVPFLHEDDEWWVVCLKTIVQEGEEYLIGLLDNLSLDLDEGYKIPR